MAVQPIPAPGATRAPGGHHASGERDDELQLVRYIVVAMLICIPVFAGVWAGIVALAATLAGVGYAAPVLMGVGIGALAGVFFGAWVGFVLFSREAD